MVEEGGGCNHKPVPGSPTKSSFRRRKGETAAVRRCYVGSPAMPSGDGGAAEEGRERQHDPGPNSRRIATDRTGRGATVVSRLLSGGGALYRRPERALSHRLV